MTRLKESRTFTIAQRDCDEQGQLHPLGLLRLFQETVMQCADELGAGNDYMLGEGLGWAVVKYDIRAVKWPHEGEQITIRTGPVGRKWLLVFRQFEAVDARGETVVHGDSCWMVLDLTQRKPTQMPDHILDAYGFRGIENCVLRFDPPGLLKDVHYETAYDVCPSDIDVNGHVNNIVYIGWAINTLPEDTAQGRCIRRLRCTYKREALLGMNIVTKAAADERDGGMVTRYELTDGNGDVLFQMCIDWE